MSIAIRNEASSSAGTHLTKSQKRKQRLREQRKAQECGKVQECEPFESKYFKAKCSIEMPWLYSLSSAAGFYCARKLDHIREKLSKRVSSNLDKGILSSFHFIIGFNICLEHTNHFRDTGNGRDYFSMMSRTVYRSLLSYYNAVQNCKNSLSSFHGRVYLIKQEEFNELEKSIYEIVAYLQLSEYQLSLFEKGSKNYITQEGVNREAKVEDLKSARDYIYFLRKVFLEYAGHRSTLSTIEDSIGFKWALDVVSYDPNENHETSFYINKLNQMTVLHSYFVDEKKSPNIRDFTFSGKITLSGSNSILTKESSLQLKQQIEEGEHSSVCKLDDPAPLACNEELKEETKVQILDDKKLLNRDLFSVMSQSFVQTAPQIEFEGLTLEGSAGKYQEILESSGRNLGDLNALALGENKLENEYLIYGLRDSVHLIASKFVEFTFNDINRNKIYINAQSYINIWICLESVVSDFGDDEVVASRFDKISVFADELSRETESMVRACLGDVIVDHLPLVIPHLRNDVMILDGLVLKLINPQKGYWEKQITAFVENVSQYFTDRLNEMDPSEIIAQKDDILRDVLSRFEKGSTKSLIWYALVTNMSNYFVDEKKASQLNENISVDNFFVCLDKLAKILSRLNFSAILERKIDELSPKSCHSLADTPVPSLPTPSKTSKGKSIGRPKQEAKPNLAEMNPPKLKKEKGKLPYNINGKKMMKSLLNATSGFELVRQKGGHAILKKGEKTIVVPVGSRNTLAKGTLRSIQKSAAASSSSKSLSTI